MTHPEALLADYVSGSLDASDTANVDEHLAGCAACTAEVSSARVARAALGFLPEIPAPGGVASRALEAAQRGSGRPGWYRWIGAAAAAAVVALVLVSLPNMGSTPAGQDSAGGTLGRATAASVGATINAPLQLVVQEINYDQAALDQLTNATVSQVGSPSEIASAGLVPSADPKQRTGTSAELQTALTCVGRAVPAKAGSPFKLILAHFNGKASFLAFYLDKPGGGKPPTSLTVWIVDGQTCTASGLSSTHI